MHRCTGVALTFRVFIVMWYTLRHTDTRPPRTMHACATCDMYSRTHARTLHATDAHAGIEHFIGPFFMLAVFVVIAVILKLVAKFKLHKTAQNQWVKIRRASINNKMATMAKEIGGEIVEHDTDAATTGTGSPQLARRSVFASRRAGWRGHAAAVDAREGQPESLESATAVQIPAFPAARGVHSNKVVPAGTATASGGGAWDLAEMVVNAVSSRTRVHDPCCCCRCYAKFKRSFLQHLEAFDHHDLL